MTYAAELDDVGRQQVRYGDPSQPVVFWPKEAGSGNITVDANPPPVWEAHRPGDGATGTPIGSGNATVDNTQGGGVSKLTASLDCSNTLTFQLNIYYYWILWTYYVGGQKRTFQQAFDVVRDPWIPSTSLNDLVEEVNDMQRRCTAQALRLDSARTPEQHASVMAMKAWGDVWEWLRQKAESDGIFIPSLIIDKEVLRRVIVAQAIHRIYRAEGGAPGTSESLLADEWRSEARMRFVAMGPLRYIIADNRAPIATVHGASVTRCSRGGW